ncbi:discoidin domain-containing protein [Paenibacillus amylolyticus]|nr:discoidin domain-containing protein [Paenibacillus amylolyticus]WFR62118.1 discoidin domain-containing protein [Paenibacillus amylolyticus]
MATVGDQLALPESGWRRYDDTHAGLNYTGSWYKVTGDKYFKGSVNVTTRAADNNYVSFSFYGTKVRIISDIAQDRHSDNTITVDGVTESFNTYKSGTAVLKAVVYEKTNLPLGFHKVTITVGHNRTNFIMDAIDIDETGYLYGHALIVPEDGWKRYDDAEPFISYTGFTQRNNAVTGAYEGKSSYNANGSAVGEVVISFVGTKVRIISSSTNTSRAESVSVSIDGNVETFTARTTTNQVQALVYEKTGLPYGTHTVKIFDFNGVVIGSSAAAFGLDAIDIDSEGWLVRSIGSEMLTPDEGWKRYDDSHPAFLYLGENWIFQTQTATPTLYNATHHYSARGMGGNEVRFKFYGTKMRLISSIGVTFANDISVVIDGVSEKFSAKIAANAATTDERQRLTYEKTNLPLGIHEVKLISGTNGDWRLDIDAIDIDSTGRLYHPDEVTDPIDLTIGKRIRCYYSTNNGVVGNFAFFGQETAPFIRTSAGAGGDLYFICVDKDRAGRLKLIADRNIQHSISWDTINASGVASGSGAPLPKKGYYISMIPAMTSNTTPQGVAAASTTYSASLEAWKAFDKNTSDAGWLMENSKWNGAWISYTFPQPKVINKYGIKGPNSNASTDGAKSWRFEGSNDGTSWIVLDTKTNQPAWSAGEYREYVFTNKDTYITYRLIFTANNGGAYVRTMAVDMFQFIEEDLMPSVDASIFRLPTGGINSSDKDNEWDMYIVNSTLNGTIIAGDDNVWNYSGGSSWTSTTNTAGSANRTGRGASGNAGASGYNPTSYIAAATATGFRPLLEIEILPISRSFIHHNGAYKKYQTEVLTWNTITATLPSEDTFINDGMGNLSVLDRKNEDFVQNMTANGSIGSGKLFKGSIDLKKYIEITNVNVK